MLIVFTPMKVRLLFLKERDLSVSRRSWNKSGSMLDKETLFKSRRSKLGNPLKLDLPMDLMWLLLRYKNRVSLGILRGTSVRPFEMQFTVYFKSKVCVQTHGFGHSGSTFPMKTSRSSSKRNSG